MSWKELMITEKDLEEKAEEFVLSAGPKGHKRLKSLALKLSFVLISVFAISGIAYGTYHYFFEPRGKITNPSEGTQTSHRSDDTYGYLWMLKN